MKISLILLLVFCFSVPCAADSPHEVEQFLASRSVVGQVYFAKRTSDLSAEGKKLLDALVPELVTHQKSGRLIRIEGFASRDGRASTNMDLSMRRALAVKSFLQRHNLTVELFLTGFGEKESITGKLSEQRRVDIAVYERTRAAAELFKKSGSVERFIIR